MGEVRVHASLIVEDVASFLSAAKKLVEETQVIALYLTSYLLLKQK